MRGAWAGLALPAALLAGCSQQAETLPLTADEIYQQALFGWCVEQLGGEPLIENTLDPTQPPWDVYVGTEDTRLYSGQSFERLSPEVHIAIGPQPRECNVLSDLGTERIGFVDRQINELSSMQIVSESSESRETRVVYQISDQPLQIEIRRRWREGERSATVLDSIVRRMNPEDQERTDD